MANYIKCPCCNLNYFDKTPDNEVCQECYDSASGIAYLQKHNIPTKQHKLTDFFKHYEPTKLPQPQEMTANEKKFRVKLLNKLNSYPNFYGFIHTTELSNFISIYQNGYLLSRNRIKKENISFKDSAMQEVLYNTQADVKKYTRFYYRPKTPTNYRALIDRLQRKPVALVFDKNLIFSKHCLFTNGNAGTQNVIVTPFASHAINFNWKEIFNDSPMDYTNGDTYQTSLQRFHRNAELLCAPKVGLKYLKEVYFRNEQDLNEAINILGNDPRFKLDLDGSKLYNITIISIEDII